MDDVIGFAFDWWAADDLVGIVSHCGLTNGGCTRCPRDCRELL
jgi:hypothetical protein